mmetsp:Transcript_25864/g.24728  ORF Transcript_25864/g.24728 Transcript_25864/m.24728 type:complete len:205 (-) Transcript_25864:1181-1795(-)
MTFLRKINIGKKVKPSLLSGSGNSEIMKHENKCYPKRPWCWCRSPSPLIGVPPIPIKLIASMSTSCGGLFWNMRLLNIPDTASTSTLLLLSSSPSSTSSNRRPRRRDPLFCSGKKGLTATSTLNLLWFGIEVLGGACNCSYWRLESNKLFENPGESGGTGEGSGPLLGILLIMTVLIILETDVSSTEKRSLPILFCNNTNRLPF